MITSHTQTNSYKPCTCQKEKTNAADSDTNDIFLPLPPIDDAAKDEMEIYGRFMRHVRLCPNSNVHIKILSGIQFTADMMDMPDALVAKILADMGLRAPRKSFPESYLDHVDKSILRGSWDFGHVCESSIDMKRFWDGIGEDKFAAFQKDYPLIAEPAKV